ncbi:unnamed protein product, partial [Ixodes persulcatus]
HTLVKSRFGASHFGACCAPVPLSTTAVCSATTKHTQDKLFKYNFCPREFAHNSLLTVHNHTHTGENLISANCAPQPLLTISLCFTAIKNTGEKTYNCKLCPQAFLGKLICPVIEQTLVKSHLGASFA